MPTRLSFSFYGDQQLDRTLERFELGAADARPAFDAMADSFARAELRQFRSEGGYGSGGWPALSPTYAAWKARHFPGQPILQRTGDLFESLTSRPFPIDVIEPQMAVFGSDVGYGVFHQEGDGVPMRKPIDLPETLRRRWVKILQRWLMTGRAGEE